MRWQGGLRDGVVREVTEVRGGGRRATSLYSSGTKVKAGTGGRILYGIAREAKPDRVDAKPHGAAAGRALNRNRGVAENGHPFVNANCTC